ncbi:MAG: PVC-type heme-binding CxxCH protein [Pirellulaceae bacterium]
MVASPWLFALLLLVFVAVPDSGRAQGYSAEEAVRRMTVADGFVVELVASEPLVRQPVAIDFDDRGRLWALQYLQYPNPAGLKRVAVDRYSRTTYDRVPEPPPRGPHGADRLTILEDTDGDGRVDRARDFVGGLNLATGFAFGYGGVFILQTPYLLFYPDRDRNDIPDTDPEVLLRGFGMEDTSSLANSLIWGPDGWLYGTQGTNLTAHIRGIEFEQGVWRYHPVSQKFELFAEGGGNMWGLDFDHSGNLLAGTNYGGYLMLHAVQGGYMQKSFGKHGELHNPYTFGYFGHVPHKNFQGGHVTVGGFIYQADAFPARLRDKYIAVDTLGHAVRWHHVTPYGSSYRSENGGVLLQANDTWFAPSDATVGPDGAVYIADWHDKRTAHPDPDATWDRSNGRVFRLRWRGAKRRKHVDPQSLTSDQLVGWLNSENEWQVRRARRVLAERRDHNIVRSLKELLLNVDDDRQALQALWTLHVVGALNSELNSQLLCHPTPVVRAWTVRLLTDQAMAASGGGMAEGTILRSLVTIAESDSSPIVIRQLASTAKRLATDESILVAGAIASRREFVQDPYIPLLTWWAIEHHAISGANDLIEAFANPTAWQKPLVRDVIIGRLMRRFAADNSKTGFAACASLLASAPNDVQRRRMTAELDAGLKMLGRKRVPGLPPGTSFSDIAIKRTDQRQMARRLEAIPEELSDALTALWRDDISDPLIIRVATRLGSPTAHNRAIELSLDLASKESTRLSMLEILQELGDKQCVDLALSLIAGRESDAIKVSALKLLKRFSDERIAGQLLANYPKMIGQPRVHARDVLLGRSASALAFLQEIDRGRYNVDEITLEQLRRVALHDDERIDALVRKHWGNIRAGTPEEKLAEIRRITNDLRASVGNVSTGRQVFKKQCANCHKLFGEGLEIGPDLTKANRQDRSFLLVSLVDPNAQIRKEYLSYILVTNSGRVVTGLLTEQNATSVTLLGAKDERTVIVRDNIAEMRLSPNSLMPEDTLKPLTPQQLRDLFRYLQSDGK